MSDVVESPADGAESEIEELLRDAARIDEVDPSCAPLEIGARLGHFEVIAEIGRGGMGIVYLAEDLALERSVALKILPGSAAHDEERRRRLLREARAAAAVSHPNITIVHEVGEAEGRIYVATERLEGETLRARMARAPLEVGQVVAIAGQLLSGLAAVHAAGLVHRDLKPDNVMIVATERVKLLDFGLAKREGDAGAATELADTTLLTRDGRVLGTPAYMSPEQAVGGTVDARSDLFSVGVMLYEMLAGRRPFTETRPSALVAAILTLEPAPPVLVRKEIGEELSRVVLRCLAKNPANRYPDCAALMADLSGSLAAPRRKRGKRWRRGLAIGLSVLAFAALFVFKPWLQRQPAPQPQPSPSALPIPPALRVIDHPPPTSNNPEALAAYALALQEFRGADFDEAAANFDRTAKLDPTIGAAYLRRVLWNDVTWQNGVLASDLFAEANRRRESMSPRDQAILDAVEPMLARHPDDVRGAVERVRALADARPNDAEIQYLLGSVTWRLQDIPAALTAVRRALDLDPGFAIASAAKSEAQFNLGDIDGAFRTARECFQRTPSAINCRKDELWFLSETNHCDELAPRARDALALRHTAAELREFLAAGLMSENAAPEAVLAALRGSAATSSWQGDYDGWARIQVALYQGDFDAALVEQRALRKAAGDDSSLTRQTASFEAYVAIALEADRTRDAADAAEAFLRVRGAYVEDTPVMDGDAAAAWALYRDHRIDRTELDRRAAALAKSWVERVEPAARPIVWAFVPGAFVTTRVEAERALSTYEPYRYLLQDWLVTPVGRALFLAGRTDEALLVLEHVAKRCIVPSQILEHLQGMLWLGRAREEKGDTKGACDAYRSILDRWGHAKPRSVTADQARGRLAASRCEAPAR